MKYIEATIIFPITILIVMSLIKLTIGFYCDLDDQVRRHDREREQVYSNGEVVQIMAADMVERGIT